MKSMEKRPHKPPRYKVRRPNPSVIKNQAPKTPAMFMLYWPSAKLYAVLGGKPACSRKYEEYPEKEFPLKFWMAQHIHTISVRRRSVPLKQSQYDAPSVIFSSSAVV